MLRSKITNIAIVAVSIALGLCIGWLLLGPSDVEAGPGAGTFQRSYEWQARIESPWTSAPDCAVYCVGGVTLIGCPNASTAQLLALTQLLGRSGKPMPCREKR